MKENIIKIAKHRANLDLMPACLPKVEVQDGARCFTTAMPGFMKREKRVSLNLSSSQKCSERFEL